MNLDQKIRAYLDHQEECGWHHDWPESLAALRAVLDLHAPDAHPLALQDVKCKGCATHVTFTEWPCATVRALAEALEVEQWSSRP